MFSGVGAEQREDIFDYFKRFLFALGFGVEIVHCENILLFEHAYEPHGCFGVTFVEIV